jgi:hypothetical protein
VVQELAAAGIGPHLAEPAGTAALRGKKRHAKTDKSDARHLRVHLMAGDLPESWIPPEHVLETRAVVRLYKDLLEATDQEDMVQELKIRFATKHSTS